MLLAVLATVAAAAPVQAETYQERWNAAVDELTECTDTVIAPYQSGPIAGLLGEGPDPSEPLDARQREAFARFQEEMAPCRSVYQQQMQAIDPLLGHTVRMTFDHHRTLSGALLAGELTAQEYRQVRQRLTVAYLEGLSLAYPEGEGDVPRSADHQADLSGRIAAALAAAVEE